METHEHNGQAITSRMLEKHSEDTDHTLGAVSYTHSDAADELRCSAHGGYRTLNEKNTNKTNNAKQRHL